MTTPTLTRRQLLQSAALAAAWSALTACASNTPTPKQTLSTLPQPSPDSLPNNLLPETDGALHLLRRTSFGPRPGDLDRVRSMGIDAYLDQQLNDAALADADNRLADLTLLNAAPAELIDRFHDKGLRPQQVLAQLVVAKLQRALHSQQQLREVMAEFWSDHFNIYALKNPAALFLPSDNRAVIRAHALGKFRDLLAASAHSPAMLVYLDNATSQAHAPNENYAREVMELHTLGVAGGYNQQDVHEVARALTGWSVAGERDAARVSRDQIGQFLFRPFMHDNDAKTILGMPFPAGGGESDGDKVMELLASHPSTAKFIAKKLCVRFVSDTPPPSILDRAAATYTQTDGDIKAILKTILTSAEFAQSIGQKYKRPFDFILASLRALNAEVTLDPNINLKAATKNNPNQALQRNPIFLQLVQLGHVPYLWSTPDGFPDKAVSWLSTSGTLGRWNFALSLVAGMRGVTIDDSSFTGISKSIEESVDRLSTLLIGTPMPANPRSILIDYAQHAADQTRLPGLAALIISSPQFQIR